MALLSLLFVFLSFRNAAMKLKTAHFRFNQKSQDDFYINIDGVIFISDLVFDIWDFLLSYLYL